MTPGEVHKVVYTNSLSYINLISLINLYNFHIL